MHLLNTSLIIHPDVERPCHSAGGTAGIYSNDHNAKLWRDNCEVTAAGEVGQNVIGMYRRLVSSSRSNDYNVISLGSGGGITDSLTIGKGDCKSYVPVDISPLLCRSAAVAMSRNTYVPYGLVADFEKHMDFISGQIDSFLTGGRLYLFLDNLGGLDYGEFKFFSGLRRIMRPEDLVIISFAVGCFRDTIMEEMQGIDDNSCLKMFRDPGEVMIKNSQGSRQISVARGVGDVPSSQTIVLHEYLPHLRLKISKYDPEALASWLSDKFALRILKICKGGSSTLGDSAGAILAESA